MKKIPIALPLACALTLSLAACDVKHWLPGADASKTPVPASTELVRQGSTVTVPEASPVRKSLEVGAVALQPFTRTLDAPGVVQALPEKMVKITPPLTGRIVRLHHQLGDVVKAGDVLATIDSPDLGAAYSDQAKTQATLLQVRQEFERQKALHTEDIGAKKDFEAAQQALSVAESDARAAGNRLLQLGAAPGSKTRREYQLRSPIAGRVVEMTGAQGGYWNDATASLMTVADLSSVWLSANVAEKDLSQVFTGQSARIVLNAYPARDFNGQVKYIGDLLDPDTRTTPVRVAVNNREGLFKPGMFARVSLTGANHDALLLPATALLQSGLYTRVFVEQQPYQYESRIVNVGASADGQVEIVSGLKAGERVVVKGGVLLND